MAPISEVPGIDDVADAAARIDGVAVRTPLLESAALNDLVGGRLLIKAEMLQVTGSFKFRGAYNRISRLDDAARQAGVIAFSSGNHAQGVAAAAHLNGAPAVIVMPDDAPRVKREGTERWGAEIVTYDRRDHDARETIAAEIMSVRGGTLVPPYDDAHIIAGQGSVGLELVAQAADRGARPDAVLTPCGGGGLTAGIATAVSAQLPDCAIHTVEPTGFDDTARSLATGERLDIDSAATSFCDALLAPRPGELTFAINSRLVTSGLVVDDDEAASAMRALFTHLKLVAEPGGAVAVAAALSGQFDCRGKTVCAVASGGNVDPGTFCDALDAA